jgi:alkylglycerol monooxygenase
MEEYAKILNYAIPGFLVLIAIEYGASCWMQLKVNRLFDTISSLSSGMTNIVKDVLGLSIVIISYHWMVTHLAISHREANLTMYIIAFIGLDFAGYWSHRFSHVVNVFWNRHIIHHSSEEFNLACALRQSVSEIFGVFFFLYIPLAIIGVPAQVIAVIAPIHLFAQFWYHTRLIGKMGILEHIIVTPSHHRVHHAINPIYMDKNYSQIFIIWDKIFGTFQSELDHEPPVYGISRPASTWNPWIINYQHLWLLITDAFYTRSWWDKIRIWWMPTGWRPEDMIKDYPVNYVSDVKNQIKYDTDASMTFNIFIIVELFATLGLMLFLFNNLGTILLYGILIFASVFAYTSMMDGSRWALTGILIKVVIAALLWMGWNFKWYNIDLSIPYGTYLMVIYFLASWILTYYFTIVDKADVIAIHHQNSITS